METITKSGLSILYWNARSFLKRKEEIQRVLCKIDILVCVESHLTPNNTNINFPGFVNYRIDRSYSTGGGIILLIRKNIAYKEITTIMSPDQSVELCGLKITNTNPTFNLLVCYRSPGLTLNIDQWDTIFLNLSKNQNNIFVGDFNAHHVVWNCNKIDKTGENLYENIEKHNLFIHNCDTYTHFDKTSKSNIDLVLSTNNIADKITTRVVNET